MPDRAELAPQTSEAIRIARVLCILGLAYVHVPPWSPQWSDPATGIGLFDMVFVFMQEALGRTSVPLLSVISGFLLVRQSLAHPAIDRVRRRLITLVLPLVLWNILFLLIYFDGADYRTKTALAWIDLVFGVNEYPAMVSLYFLRDIFVCVLLFPLLQRLLVRHWLLTIGAIAALSALGLLDVVFIKSTILVFFALGAAIGLRLVPPVPLRPVPIMCLALLLAVASAAAHIADLRGAIPDGFVPETLLRILSLAERFAGAALFWLIARRLCGTVAGQRIGLIEPFIFFYFCSHIFYLTVGWRGIEAIGGYASPVYPLFFLTVPLWSLAMGLAVGSVLLALAPGPLRILCGGRLPKPLDLAHFSRAGLRP